MTFVSDRVEADGVLGLPITFLIGRDGQIAAKYVGPVQMPVVERQIRSLLQER